MFHYAFVCVRVSDKINNETLILFYLQEGLIRNEQKLVINYHFNVIPPRTEVEQWEYGVATASAWFFSPVTIQRNIPILQNGFHSYKRKPLVDELPQWRSNPLVYFTMQ